MTNLDGKKLHQINKISGIKGFSLVELMITFAIIAILTTIAVPAYSDYVKRGRAAEATSNLADMRIKIEQYFQDNRTFVDAPCNPTSETKSFTFACSDVTETTYTITATGDSQKLPNFEFTINQDNQKTSKFDGTVGTDCWLTSKGSSC